MNKREETEMEKEIKQINELMGTKVIEIKKEGLQQKKIENLPDAISCEKNKKRLIITSFLIAEKINAGNITEIKKRATKEIGWSHKSYIASSEIDKADKHLVDSLKVYAEAYGVGLICLGENPEILIPSKMQMMKDADQLSDIMKENDELKMYIEKETDLMI